MQSIGLSVEEIAIVYLALPLTTFLAPPVSGTYYCINYIVNIIIHTIVLLFNYPIDLFKFGSIGFLVDKFGQYKPVLFISLALNAIFHHSLMLIPQMETPGAISSAYVMRHPESGKVDVLKTLK